MASSALFNLQLERMRAVAVDAGIVPINMGKVAVVRLAFILVAALGQGAVLRCGSGKVVDVAEAEVGTHGIHICSCCLFDRRVHADLGLASLMAFHAARLVAQIREFDAGGHDHTGLGDCAAVVTGNTVHDRADRSGSVNHVDLAAVRTDMVLVSYAAVTLCARHGNFGWIFLIPVHECLGGGIGMRRSHPLVKEGHRDSHRHGIRRSGCIL